MSFAVKGWEMVELLGWIGLVISFSLMLYHQYMHSNYDRVYGYIQRRYGARTERIQFPSKDDHSQGIRKYSYCTAFFAALLIILNVISGWDRYANSWNCVVKLIANLDSVFLFKLPASLRRGSLSSHLGSLRTPHACVDYLRKIDRNDN